MTLQVNGNKSARWVVNFNNGNVNNNDINNNACVRAVRGGECQCNEVVSLQQIYDAWVKARKGKKPSANQLNFDTSWSSGLLELQLSINDCSWQPKPSTCFIAARPKAREIHAPDFSDRVMHHWLVPQLEKLWQPAFITEHANASSQRNMPADEPLRTQCAQVKGGHFALVAPVVARQFGKSIGHGVNEPSGTITAGGDGKSQLVAAFLAKHYGGNYTGPGASLQAPTPTITTVDHNALVTSHLVKLRGTCKDGQPVTEPMPTITAGGNHVGEVRAFLLKYYGNEVDGADIAGPIGTITTRDRFGLVTVNGVDHVIVDIGMRMLQPHELFKAQGFPDDYIIDRDSSGKPMTKTAQVARCGNSVPPAFAEALTRANLPELCTSKQEQAA